MSTASQRAFEVGEAYEESLSPIDRRLGAHFTPRDVAVALVDAVWRRRPRGEAPVVCDPSCGGGVFLVAAAERLRADGVDPVEIVERHLVGFDLDPGAVEATAEALRRWAADVGVSGAVTPRVLVGDGLDAAGRGEFRHFDGTIDVVVGNPPFRNQLESRTARDAEARRLLAGRFGLGATGYVDLAALFLLRGLELLRPGGIMCLIQPRSLLAARDAAPVRRTLLADHRLVAMWLPGEQVFEAAVDVCAPIVIRGGTGVCGSDGSTTVGSIPDGSAPDGSAPDGSAPDGSAPDGSGRGAGRGAGSGTGTDTGCGTGTELLTGRLVTPTGETVEVRGEGRAATWSALWAVANGVPSVDPPRGAGATDGVHGSASAVGSPGVAAAVLGSIATATAGFRDQFYGVLPHLCPERPPRGARVVTSGMIDPFDLTWATRPSRIGGRTWVAPWVDLEALAEADPPVSTWVERLLRPKVLVATQTRVIEVVIDPEGDLVPLTPVIAVVPEDPAMVGHVATALLAPQATAWAARRFGGGGMSHTALKLAASQLLEIPLPSDVEAWNRIAPAAFEPAPGDRPGWERLAAELAATWGVADPDLCSWWVSRLPQMSSHRRRLR